MRSFVYLNTDFLVYVKLFEVNYITASLCHPNCHLILVFCLLLFSCPVVSNSAIPGTAARQASLLLPISRNLTKFTFITSVMPSSHFILWQSLLLPSVFAIIRDFSNELALCIRWPKYWSFSFSISPSNEYSGLISLKSDLFDLAVQGTLRNLLQYHSSKVSILLCSASFMVQLSQPCVTTEKTIALTIWTFVGRVMSLLFNTPSRCVIAFLPRSSCRMILRHHPHVRFLFFPSVLIPAWNSSAQHFS